ncbi:DUF3105 domain-containing protein [Amycolatopsis sp. SID8362]|uniref:DUF3105 domain-containing protein n=1 Tax=Amycolatopsis sp. SID8362 TaxID=2690346 RepID=UPI001368833C|nr:DUF3105 domain-containing protein [Amycolatopsis sp. SID8362]NBH07555.1 DUF3105 domain-containing protein [Amycolatopsis sp. SID8362]NED44251.1 DUF3105 domain-containing protein [Amycolatopsis sp. SID8362]
MKAARGSVVSKKGTPWGTIIAVVAIVALAGAVITYYMVASAPKREQSGREAAAASFAPTASDPDPSKRIPGVVTANYTGSVHVLPTERVAYDKTPPFGGPHDGYWATCTGKVYPNAVRTENMVHALEHGAVWIAYNPQQVTGDALNLLKVRVEGKPYTMMSPYPGLDKPISLQSWGHQLKLDKADDARIDEFIAALRSNPNGVYPEVGASCDALGAGQFDPDNPPPFDPSKPGPDAKPMDYKGTPNAQTDQNGGMSQQPSAPASGTPTK